VKILFIVETASIHAAKWINQLIDTGWDIHIFQGAMEKTCINPEFKFGNFYLPYPLPATNVISQQSLFTSEDLIHSSIHKVLDAEKNFYAKYLAETIDRVRPDIVHSLGLNINWRNIGLVVYGAKKILGEKFDMPWIYSSWGTDLDYFARMSEKNYIEVKAILENVDYYISECQRDIRLALEMGFKGKVLGIFPAAGGFDDQYVRDFYHDGPTSARKAIIVKGRGEDQDPVGRALKILDGFELLPDILQGFEINIFQATPKVRERAKELSAKYNLRITMLEYIPYTELLGIIGKSRIFIALTINDGLPLSLVEAISLGAFPIHSDLESVRDVIRNSENGLLVPLEEPTAFAEALKKALTDDEMVDNGTTVNTQIVKSKLLRSVVQPEVIKIYGKVTAKEFKSTSVEISKSDQKTILITGAHGFVGRNAAKFFHDSGYYVVGIGHGKWPTENHKDFGIDKWKEADITLGNLEETGKDFDIILHCAGGSLVSYSVNHPFEEFDKTVISLAAVLEYMRLHNREAKLIYPSSAAVYGSKKNKPIKETYELNPISPYGFHKRIAEELIESYHNNFNIKAAIVRFFSIYGKGLKKQLLWDACNKFNLDDKEVIFFGTGEETRDWINIEDAVRLIHKLTKSDKDFEIVNGASGIKVTIKEVLNLMAEEFSNRKVLFSGNFREGDPRYYHADPKKAFETGWRPDISLKKGIKEYVQWYKSKKDEENKKLNHAGHDSKKGSGPFFSILVPSYNQAQYLPAALDSLLAQSYPNWEALVVNDGSTDETPQVMEKYAALDKRIRLFHKQNGGVASALNEGLRNAQGEWICWLSSDDLFEPDKLEVHFQAIKEFPAIKFFYTHFSYLNEKSGIKSEPDLWHPVPPKELQITRFFLGPYIHGNSICINRSVFDQTGIFDEAYRYGQDFDMWLRISAAFPSEFINRRTCITRWHDNQTTNQFPEAGFYDSARACIKYLNVQTFREVFPLLDLAKMEDIAKAIEETIVIAFSPSAIIHKCGYNTALLERFREWLVNDCPPSLKQFAIEELSRYINSRIVPQLPVEISNAFAELLNISESSFQFVPHNFIAESKEHVTNLFTAGREKEAGALERYLTMISSFDDLPLNKDRFHEVLFYYAGLHNSDKPFAGTNSALLNIASILSQSENYRAYLTGDFISRQEIYKGVDFLPLPAHNLKVQFLKEYDIVIFATHIGYFADIEKPTGQKWILYQHCWTVEPPELARISDFDAVICLSDIHKKTVLNQKVPEEKIKVFPNSIDISHFYPRQVKRKPHSILFAGAIVPLKGVHILIDAFKLVKQLLPDAELNIFGSASLWRDSDIYEKNLKSAGIPGVIFHGTVLNDKMPLIYSQNSLLCLPSEIESFGIVAVEAQACGCIPVVHNNGGGAATLLDKQTGFLYSPNTPQNLAVTIVSAFSQLDSDSSLRSNAIQFVQSHFSIQHKFQDFVNILQDLLPNPIDYEKESPVKNIEQPVSTVAATSELDHSTPPEIKDDEFYYTIQKLAKEEAIKTVLEIGSSTGAGSTEAFVTGLRENPNRPKLFCMEISKPRFHDLQNRYKDDPFVICYNVSSVPLEKFPTEEEVINFYNTIRTSLNIYPIEQVLGWLRQDKKYLKESGVQGNGIELIKKENHITTFDMVLIDGSAFTGSAELDEVYGAKFILLDDINDIKNSKSYQRLIKDSNYSLIIENWKLRNGFAVFKKNDALSEKILFSVAVGDNFQTSYNSLTKPRFLEYAKYHGFEFQEITSYSDSRHQKPHWAKIKHVLYLLDKLQQGGLITYLDADIAIVVGDVKLTTTKSIALAKDSAGIINTGVFAVRVNDFSKRFFQAVWDRSDCDNHPWQDNLAVLRTLDELTNDEREQHIEILPNSLNVTLIAGEYPEYDKYMSNPCYELVRFRHFAGGQPWFKKYFTQPILFNMIQSQESNLSQSLDSPVASKNNHDTLPIHFFTIVLNGEPFIRHHIDVFRQLPFKWHWHIIEGVADLKHDTAWSLQFGARITDEIHRNGLSNDGTTEYLDKLMRQYPDNITLYRKENGKFWDGKLEMVSAPLTNINEECLLWQIDADELWTIEQINTVRSLFIQYPEKTAAYYFCNYHVGENLIITTRDTYGNHTSYEWLRTWRFKPGDLWMSHEPPRFCRRTETNQWVDISQINPLIHSETESRGLIFQHYAYVTEAQLYFKERYFGYKDAVKQWQRLQRQTQFPVFLRDYFKWVNDAAQVNTALSQGIHPIAQKDNSGIWQFQQHGLELPKIKHILWVRTDSIGDNVLASSMLPYIKEKYKDAKITVLCQEHIAELYEICPFVDTVATFNRSQAYQDENYRNELIQKLQALNADLSLNSVYSREPLNDFFTLGSNAKQRIAFNGNLCNIQKEIRDENNKYYTRLLPSEGDHKTELERHRDFLRGIGIEVPKLEPKVWLSSEDEEFAENFFRTNNLDPEKTVALFAVAQFDHKIYAHAGLAISPICKERSFSVVALGSAADFAFNQQNLDAIGVRTLNMCGKTTLRQTAAVLKKCRLAIGSDTACAHFACAVGTPNVVILGGGHIGRFLPYSPLTSAVCVPLECYGCDFYCKYQRVHCVKDILPEVLTEAVRQTLDNSSEKPRVFVQGKSLWNPNAGQPAWRWFNEYLDVQAVEIIPVGDVPEIPQTFQKQNIAENIMNEITNINNFLRSGMLEDANKSLKHALEKYPDSPDLLNLQAILKLHMKDSEGAKGILFDLIKNQPAYYPAYLNLACIFWNDKDFDNASKYFEEALRMSNYDKAVVSAYGEMLFSYKKYAKSKEVYEGYLKINPNDAEILSLLKKSADILDKLTKFKNIAGKTT
jgi:nucleoside-diphosphate-sugar epimerase/glycosyltransferase involved in cell wall biosynthesis/ADP-heptose:LPS heptosyltransferase/GT2 family glycosyltransferase